MSGITKTLDEIERLITSIAISSDPNNVEASSWHVEREGSETRDVTVIGRTARSGRTWIPVTGIVSCLILSWSFGSHRQLIRRKQPTPISTMSAPVVAPYVQIKRTNSPRAAAERTTQTSVSAEPVRPSGLINRKSVVPVASTRSLRQAKHATRAASDMLDNSLADGISTSGVAVHLRGDALVAALAADRLATRRLNANEKARIGQVE